MKKFFVCTLSLLALFHSNIAYCAEKIAYNYISDVPVTKKDHTTESTFLAVAFRTKQIKRWCLFDCRKNESLNDHLMDTARIAHILTLIKNKKYGGQLDENRVAVLAMYHDLTEVISGDMPTPIKYNTPGMKPLYSKMEDKITQDMLSLLPEDFKNNFSSILNRNEDEKELWQIVKHADTISAFIKCLEERKLNNDDFDNAYIGLEKSVLEINSPEVQYFVKTFLPAFGYKPNESINNQQ